MVERRQYAAISILFLVVCAILVVINHYTQPAEEVMQLVPRGMSFWMDWVWWVDDILGPAWFIAGALTFYFGRVAWRGNWLRTWPLALIAGICFAFGVGDTLDAHWVYAAQVESIEDLTNVTSNLGKLTMSILFVWGALYAAPWLRGRARRALYLVAFMMIVNLQTLSIWLDFAGYAFHVFEELLEVVAGVIFALIVALEPLRAFPDED